MTRGPEKPERPAGGDRSLIAGYLSGDEEEFRRVDDWIAREVDFRYASLRAEREDLIQEVHQKLVANLRSGRFRHRSSFRTYVTSVVNYTCIDGLRRKYLHRLTDLPPDLAASSGDPYRVLESEEEGRLLHRVLQLSPEVCRRLWKMIFRDGLHYRAIGERMGIPAGTVKSRVFHCRKKALAIYRSLVGGAAD